MKGSRFTFCGKAMFLVVPGLLVAGCVEWVPLGVNYLKRQQTHYQLSEEATNTLLIILYIENVWMHIQNIWMHPRIKIIYIKIIEYIDKGEGRKVEVCLGEIHQRTIFSATLDRPVRHQYYWINIGKKTFWIF